VVARRGAGLGPVRHGRTVRDPGSLLDSPPHRAILLDPGFRDLGIGAVHGAPQGPGAGALTVALDFGRVLR
jgi:hypothetical protein